MTIKDDIKFKFILKLLKMKMKTLIQKNMKKKKKSNCQSVSDRRY